MTCWLFFLVAGLSDVRHYGVMRLFAAIIPPPDVLDHCANALDQVRSGNPRLPRNPWIPSVNWHVTLAFYGEVPDGVSDELSCHLADVAGRTSGFPLALAGAGVFRHDVCWIGVSDPLGALVALARDLRGEWAQVRQHAENRFHLTVSRSGRRADLESAMKVLSVYRGPEWLADRIRLYRSDLGEGVGGHPQYTLVAESVLVG